MPEPLRFQQGLTPLSFRLSFSDMSLPSGGGVETYVDRFLGVAHDAALERAFVLFDQRAAASGVLRVRVVQNMGDGEIVGITDDVTFTEADIEPVELPLQQERIAVGRPLYLRLRALPGSAAPFWETATEIVGTLWFLNTD